MSFRWIAALLLVAGVIHVTAGNAMAASGVKIGVLKCTVDGGVGLILGSKKHMNCDFAPTGGGPDEFYHGRVIKIGLDIGVTEKSYITWLVFAPGKLKPGALAGSYVGAT